MLYPNVAVDKRMGIFHPSELVSGQHQAQNCNF